MSDATSHQQVGESAQNGFNAKDMQKEFGSNYMQPASQHPNYGFPATEQYVQNYYGQMAFPYVGEWSTGGESVPYLPAYNSVGNGEPHRSFMQDAMFNQQSNNLGNGQAYFNAPVFQQGNEFTAWTSPPGHNASLDVTVGHQSSSTYNGDFYHPILPPMPQDYLERNDPLNNPTTIGSIPTGNQGPQGNFMTIGLSSGDGIGKLPGASNSTPMLERGMQAMNVAGGVGSDVEPVLPKGSQMNPNNMAARMDNASHRVEYGPGSVQMSVGQATNAPPTPPANKPISWAAIASKPAKPQAKPKTAVGLPPPIKHMSETGNWETGATIRTTNNTQVGSRAYGWNGPRPSHQSYEKRSGDAEDENLKYDKDDSGMNLSSATPTGNQPVLDKLKLKLQNDYNPKRLTMDLRNSRFFVIKSYSEDDIHRSIKYNIWCSTEHGNKRLDATFRAQKNRGPVILLYSVNGSGHFCGVAEMNTCVDYSSRAGVWSQDKWKGKFQVKWIYIKDVPNTVLRHIRLENNENKPVTNSRDTQEVPAEKGRQVLKIIANYKHQTSIFDDFGHYERRQQEEENQKNRAAAQSVMNRDRKSGENPESCSLKTASAE